MRERSVTDLSPCVTEVLPEGSPATPAFVDLSASVLWCVSCQQAQPVRLQDKTHYCTACGAEVGHKTQRVSVTPVAPSNSSPVPVMPDEAEEPWPEPPEEPLTPEERFDEIEAMSQALAEEVPAPSVPGSAQTQACPQCRCTNLHAVGKYRKCPLCNWKGKVVQPGESEVSA